MKVNVRTMAKEMMEQTKNSILSQAAQAMLAQANQATTRSTCSYYVNFKNLKGTLALLGSLFYGGKGMKKPRKAKIISKSDYSKGVTVLDLEQKDLLKHISRILNYSDDNYKTFPQTYAPAGLISILRGQVKVKLDNVMIDRIESKEATAMIDLLETKLIK